MDSAATALYDVFSYPPFCLSFIIAVIYNHITFGSVEIYFVKFCVVGDSIQLFHGYAGNSQTIVPR